MDLRFSQEDEAFRAEVAAWLADNLKGEFASVRGRGGPGDEHALFDERLAWERHIGPAGWTCVGWPTEHGGRGAVARSSRSSSTRSTRAPAAPGRLGHIGEGLLGPTLIALRHRRAEATLPAARSQRVEELWCQGYSEPNAGSDLANVQTRAELDGDEWVLNGQKVWTSRRAVVALVLRALPHRARRAAATGLSYLLVPMKQPGIEIRPDRADHRRRRSSARSSSTMRVRRRITSSARPDDGWKVAMGTLAFERGASRSASSSASPTSSRRSSTSRARTATASDPVDAPAARACLDRASRSCATTRCACSRSERRGAQPRGDDHEALLGHVAPRARQARDGRARCAIRDRRRLPVRAHAACSACSSSRVPTRSTPGSNQIQRNIIAERALGLPREPKVAR